VLSGFNPIGALKSKVVSKMAGGISLRRSLVVVQFCIAQILVICTLVVMRQTAYFQSTSMGFDKQAIITFPLINDSAHLAKYDYLRNQLEQIPGIKALSFSYASPADKANWFSDLRFDHSTKSTQFGANLKWADTNYFKLYNLHLVAGRLYFQSDTIREFVVNETLVKELGFNDPQKIIGKELNFWNGIVVGPVVGVVKDFHTTSLRAPIPPVVMGHAKDTYQAMNIKIESQKASEILAQVEDIWTATFPEYVYEFHFLDERIGDFYKQETQLSLLYKIFAAIAIFISCLGLYGLVSFMAVQRNKEVGIRKVLGASVRSIVYLFSKEFTVLIAIAFLIAAPVAYYFMHHWLANFTFRIPLSWTLFALAGLSSVVIAWLAVGYKAVKAAITNPVNSIRTQ
jgi:ABC-type antimicrobial peptide transport system permease subunit